MQLPTLKIFLRFCGACTAAICILAATQYFCLCWTALLQSLTVTLRTQSQKQRNFDMLKICLTLPRQQLCERINQRTDAMMENGFLQEAESLLPYRHLNALNTVGYKELFDYLDGKTSLDASIEKIKTNTRRYAKRQITWFKGKEDYVWVKM